MTRSILGATLGWFPSDDSLVVMDFNDQRAGTISAGMISKEMVQPDSVLEPYQVWKVMFQTVDTAS